MKNIIENINISSIEQIISPEILKNRLRISDELKKQVLNFRNEISDIIWEYVMSFSPLLNKLRPEIEVQLLADSKWEVGLMRQGYD